MTNEYWHIFKYHCTYSERYGTAMDTPYFIYKMCPECHKRFHAE